MMDGYHFRLFLYSQTETWREIKIPKNINFKQLHLLIQEIFGFKDYHMWEFKVPFEIPDSDEVDLNNITRTISQEESETLNISEILDGCNVLLYEYDFGDSWEIIVYKLSDCDYNNKTALITDYCGKYNPMDDMGGVLTFDEIMQSLDDEDELEYVLEDYGLTRQDLSKMDFENKYKKGSKIRIK